MKPKRWQEVKNMLASALERPPQAGSAYLEREPKRDYVSLTLTLIIVLDLVWLALSKYVVPPLIKSAYRGESSAIFNRMITGQAFHRVDEYLADWDRLYWWVLLEISLAGLLILLILLIIRLELKPWRLRLFALGVTGFALLGVTFSPFMAGVTVAGVVLALWMPRLGDKGLAAIERFGTHLAQQKVMAIVSVGIAAAVLRMGLLVWVSVPSPSVHDEFSYLLSGDTFAHGRLTNPPHPMWAYFDTFHVLQHPTYMSKYPPAQGFLLAFGQILGHPWIGVLLSVAGMCAAVVWALQGWLPARWALLGGSLVLLRFAIVGYWIDSYWGGSVAALGGALAIGALPRILRSRRPRDATILGIGVSILANSRPLEGLVFCVPVFGVLIAWLCRRQGPPWKETFPRIIVPLLTILILCGSFMAYYNWRGTGSPTVFPYVTYETDRSSVPLFQWQKVAAPIHYQNPQFDAFYNKVAPNLSMRGRIKDFRSFMSVLAFDVERLVVLFSWPELFVVLLLTFPWVLRDRRVRLLAMQTLFCIGGFLLVVWFLPHYAAPLTATVFCLTTQGFRHLRKWQLQGRPVGIGLSRVLVLLAMVLIPSRYYRHNPMAVQRARIERELNALPGEHLVIVHYSSQHNSHLEWVHNGADIDHAKVVWAREIPGFPSGPLLAYFRGRRVWLVDADAGPPVAVEIAAPR